MRSSAHGTILSTVIFLMTTTAFSTVAFSRFARSQEVAPNTKVAPNFSRMTVRPAALRFKPINFPESGKSSETSSFTVFNTGRGAVNLNVTVSGPSGRNANAFNIINGGGTLVPIAPGSSATVTVQFTPRSDGASVANVLLTSDGTRGARIHSQSLIGSARGLIPTGTATFSATATPTITASSSETATPTPTATASATMTVTSTSTATASETATLTDTPTSTATMIVSPLIKNSGAVDNSRTGGTAIVCMAGTGVLQHELILLAINLVSPTSPPNVTITPPNTVDTIGPTGSIPAWHQIGTTITVANYQQALFWHEVGDDTTELTGEFAFTFSSSVRAACAAATLMDTCLQSPIGCPNNYPIFDYSFGTSTLSFQITQVGTSLRGADSGKIKVPSQGEIFGAFGTSNSFSQFGVSSSAVCNSNGGVCPDPNAPGNGGTFDAGMGAAVNGIGGKNGGLTIAIKGFISAIDGPFSSTLPNRIDPQGINLSNIAGNGTTAIGTTAAANLSYIDPTGAVLKGYIVGTESGFDTPSPNSVSLSTNGGTMFSFPSSIKGSVTGGAVFEQDPAVGNNVSQVVSIVPNLTFPLKP